MSHHRNRLAAILLAAVLTGGLVTGCGKTAPAASGPAPEVLDAVRVDDCTVELTFSQSVRVEDVRHLYAESGGVLLPETTGKTVRVTDCGAVPNDGQDDAESLQKALDQAGEGGTVYFPAGEYLVSRTLLFTSSQTLIFDDEAVLKRGESACTCLLSNRMDGTEGGYTATENVSIIGATFDGNDQLDTPVTLLSHAHSRDIRVVGCEFRNGRDGHYYDCSSSEQVLIMDCVFDGDTLKGANATMECLRISAAAEGEWRTVETADGPQPVLYDGTVCADVTVSGCLFGSLDNPNCVALGSRSGAHRAIRVQDCDFLGGSTAKAAAAFDTGAEDVVLADNLFRGNGRSVMATGADVAATIYNEFYENKTSLYGDARWITDKKVKTALPRRVWADEITWAEMEERDGVTYGTKAVLRFPEPLEGDWHLAALAGAFCDGAGQISEAANLPLEGTAPVKAEQPQLLQQAEWLDGRTVRLTFNQPTHVDQPVFFEAPAAEGILYDTPGPAINVLDYGAVPDDGAYDSETLQAAIDAARDGGLVWFPAGVYDLNKCLGFYSNQTLLFEPGAVLMRATYTGAGTLLMNYYTPEDGGYSAVENVNIIGATFDGNPDIDETDNLLNTFHARNINVIGCTFRNCNYWHCYESNSTASLRLLDCVFEDKYFALQPRSEYLQLDRAGDDSISNLFDTPSMGFDSTCCTDILVSNCVFDSTTTQAVAIGNHTPYAHHNVRIQNNLFLGGYPLRGAISFAEGIYDFHILNNTFKNMPVGLDCSSGENLKIYSDNVFENVEQISRGAFQQVEEPGETVAVPTLVSGALTWEDGVEKDGVVYGTTALVTLDEDWGGGAYLLLAGLMDENGELLPPCTAEVPET